MVQGGRRAFARLPDAPAASRLRVMQRAAEFEASLTNTAFRARDTHGSRAIGLDVTFEVIRCF